MKTKKIIIKKIKISAFGFANRYILASKTLIDLINENFKNIEDFYYQVLNRNFGFERQLANKLMSGFGGREEDIIEFIKFCANMKIIIEDEKSIKVDLTNIEFLKNFSELVYKQEKFEKSLL